MSTESIRRELARLVSDAASIKKQIAREEDNAAKARKAAAKKRSDAAKAKSDSSRRSATSAAEREESKVVSAEKKIGTLSDKLAKTSASQASKSASLAKSEKSDQQATDRADKKRRDQEKVHAREIARISAPQVRYSFVPEPKPTPLRVLYLTANPEATERHFTMPDGTEVQENTWLRTEAEVKHVRDAVRGSKYRDQVMIEHRPAASLDDLLNGLNDVRPHIVHFSGHGGAGQLLMDNGSVGSPEGELLSFDLLARALGATSTPPVLLILNACDTLGGAEVLLESVQAVIAMSRAVSDVAASTFATFFYAALGGGQSLQAAFDQAQIKVEATSLDEADTPQMIARDDVDLAALVLVQPVE